MPGFNPIKLNPKPPKALQVNLDGKPFLVPMIELPANSPPVGMDFDGIIDYERIGSLDLYATPKREEETMESPRDKPFRKLGYALLAVPLSLFLVFAVSKEPGMVLTFTAVIGVLGAGFDLSVR